MTDVLRKQLRQRQLILLGGLTVFHLIVAICEVIWFAEELAQNRSPLDVVYLFAGVAGPTMWVALDCKIRRSEESFKWVANTIFLGPIAVVCYLFVHYRGRRMLAFALAILAYAVVLAPATAVSALMV